VKIGTLIGLLQGRNLDDDVFIPCGPGELSDRFQVQPFRVKSRCEGVRRVILEPLEGGWKWDSALAPGVAPVEHGKAACPAASGSHLEKSSD